MRVSRLGSLLLQFSLLSLLHTSAFAAKKSYIVYLGAHPHGPNPTLDDLDRAENYHHEFLGSVVGSHDEARELITASYKRHINGFAAYLEEEHAQKLANHPEVVSVFLNRPNKRLTTRVWNFLGLEEGYEIPQESAWNAGKFGEDIIIGGIDSGIWPESQSFSDNEIGPVPGKWRGTCQNDTHFGVSCNRKVIGIKHYNKGVILAAQEENSSAPIPPDLHTGRDLDGHGTHTLSAAGGNFVPNVGIYGNGYGAAKGGCPKARVASYKVCFYSDADPNPDKGDDCTQLDTIAAFDEAIHDGVDILTVSLGYAHITEFLGDGVVIGAFHAMLNGILTVAAAGNGGPKSKTVNNMAPWMLTVGAGTLDREFASYVTLGNQKRLRGASLSKDMPQDSFPLITGEAARRANTTGEAAKLCRRGTLDPLKVVGKIIVCERQEKGYSAFQAGAVAMITGANGTFAPTYGFLPVTKLNLTDLDSVFQYIRDTENPVASMTDAETELDIKPAPAMASFSSRGPNAIDPNIIKPDVIAPGVSIISAFTEQRGPTIDVRDRRRVSYSAMDGTSMATPIVAGIAGLIKAAHPDWSPAAIKSAIMTTAKTTDESDVPIVEWNGGEATPFAYGSGNVCPNCAMDPGLVYDLSVDDYLGYLCNRGYKEDVVKQFVVDTDKFKCPKPFDLGNFNYPSIAIPELNGNISVTRRVKNVGTPGTYRANVTKIPGISVQVEPDRLQFAEANEEKTFRVTFTPETDAKTGQYVFGQLVWLDDSHHRVRSPIALKLRKQ